MPDIIECPVCKKGTTKIGSTCVISDMIMKCECYRCGKKWDVDLNEVIKRERGLDLPTQDDHNHADT